MSPAAPKGPAHEVLRWTCDTCGWTCDVPMPGYAGTQEGHHYRGGRPDRPCGPLTARLAGYKAQVGTPGIVLKRLAARAAYLAEQDAA